MCIITLQLRNGRLELRTPFCSYVRKLMLWIRNEEFSLIVHWCLAIASWSWGTPQVTSCNDGLGHLLDVMSLSCVVESVRWGSFDLWFFLVLDRFRLCAPQSVTSLIMVPLRPLQDVPIYQCREKFRWLGALPRLSLDALAPSTTEVVHSLRGGSDVQGLGIVPCMFHLHPSTIPLSIPRYFQETSRLRSDESFCHLSLLHGLQDGTARIFELHTGKSLSILGGQLGQDWRAYKSHQKPLFDTLQVMHIQILNDDCIWLATIFLPTSVCDWTRGTAAVWCQSLFQRMSPEHWPWLQHGPLPCTTQLEQLD